MKIEKPSAITHSVCYYPKSERWYCGKCGQQYEGKVDECEQGCCHTKIIGKATIYWYGLFSFHSEEVSEVEFGHEIYAQYKRCPFAVYKPKGRRKKFVWRGGSCHWIAIVPNHITTLTYEQLNQLADEGKCLFEDRTDGPIKYREENNISSDYSPIHMI